MKDKILLNMLGQHGFSSERGNVRVEADNIIFKLRKIDDASLVNEGADVPADRLPPGARDWKYHNYVYFDGLAPGLSHFIVTKHQDGQHKDRPKSICYSQCTPEMHQQIQEIIGNCNLLEDTSHSIVYDESCQEIFININYSTGGSGLTPFNKLVNQLVIHFQPRMAGTPEIKGGIHYVSDLGRLALFLTIDLQSQINALYLQKMTPERDTQLLTLRDSRTDDQQITLKKSYFYNYIERSIREEGFFVNRVRPYLQLDQKNWCSCHAAELSPANANTDGARLFQSKVKQSRESATPLYISMTSGAHAFAIKVDFQNNTLFLANPSGDYSCFGELIEQLKVATGCLHLCETVTRQMNREAFPFNDSCTVDSITLIDLMMKHPLPLSKGCFNQSTLNTATLVRNAFSNQMSSDIGISCPQERTIVPRHVSSSFFLNVMTHPATQYAGYFLILLGLTGITLASCGVAGIPLLVASASIFGVGATSSLLSFYAKRSVLDFHKTSSQTYPIPSQ